MTVLKEYQEGRTTFLSADVDHYSSKKGQPTSDMPVFYNPRMRTNRDLSVLVLDTFSKTHRMNLICEPLTGSGIRSLRYLNEVRGDFHSVMFDTSSEAVEIAKKNLEANGFDARAQVILGDARILLLTESRGKRFDFIDIDPFGSPNPFINAAFQAINPRRGLIGITATDMPALCGVYPKVALRKYGGMSIRSPFVHELALRLVLGATFFVAGMNDFSISPILSLSTDHYVRVWIETKASKSGGNRDAQQMGFVRYCSHCMAWDMIPVLTLKQSSDFKHIKSGCPDNVDIAGPLWIGPIQNPSFVTRTTETLEEHENSMSRKSKLMLNLIKEEAPIQEFYLDLHQMCDIYSWPPPKQNDVITDLKEVGYQCVRSHFKPTAIRTNATVEEVTRVVESIVGDR
jgi:tRNA (guanine26-N2/guanine27-N2)-dimethyltransferase